MRGRVNKLPYTTSSNLLSRFATEATPLLSCERAGLLPISAIIINPGSVAITSEKSETTYLYEFE